MVFGILLAGGSGTRINANMPKQFVEIGGKPVLYHTVKNLLHVSRLSYLYISVHPNWLNYTRKMVEDRFPEDARRIRLILGGKERQDSINHAVAAISRDFKVKNKDIVLIHEAARPFATPELFDSCIDGAMAHGCAVCAQPASDTMFVSADGEMIDHIPDRRTLFHGQAPDCYNLKQFIRLEAQLTPEQRSQVTGDAQIWTMNGVPIHMIPGTAENFKITTKRDMMIATYLLSLEE